MDLAIMHAAVITGFEKEVNDFPLHVCVCCEQQVRSFVVTCVARKPPLA